MPRENLEFKVGLFVIVSTAVLAWLIFRAGDFQTAAGYPVRFLFASVRGVESGSSVRLAGVAVGEVREVRVVRSPDGQTQVQVMAWIQQDVPISKDAVVRIGSLGFLGEKFVEILPGSGAETVAPGGELQGRTPVELEDVAEAGNQLIATVDTTIANINDTMGDPKFRHSFKNTFAQTEIITQNLSEASQDLKDAAKSAKIILGRIRDGEGSVGRLLKDDKIARDLEAFVADLKAHPWKLLKRG